MKRDGQNTDTKNQIVGHLTTFIEFLKKQFRKLDADNEANATKSKHTDSTVLQALQLLQNSVNRLKWKNKTTEAKIMDAIKAYAEIVKSTIPARRLSVEMVGKIGRSGLDGIGSWIEQA